MAELDKVNFCEDVEDILGDLVPVELLDGDCVVVLTSERVCVCELDDVDFDVRVCVEDCETDCVLLEVRVEVVDRVSVKELLWLGDLVRVDDFVALEL